MFDIAVDRVVENVLWIVLADLNLIPIWVAIVFITRSLMVDSIRSQAAAQGKAPFAIMKSAIGKFLVAGRFMRGFYGTVKAVTFAWILLIQPWPALFSRFWNEWSPTIAYVTDVLIYFSVAICLLRGIPVLVEAYITDGGLIRNNRIRGSR